MRAKFKPGCKKNMAASGNKLKGDKRINPFDAMFRMYNLNDFYKFFGKIPKNALNHHKTHSRPYVKRDYIKKPSDAGKNDITDILPAIEHDIIDRYPVSGHDISSYHAGCGLGDFQIQAVLKLDGRLDLARLTRAVRLSVDAEPVLGCRFVEDETPYWKRLDNIDGVAFCSMEETDNPNEAVMGFLRSTLDMDNDPMLKVKIIRSKQYDILGIKLNHACCDGTGVKEYIRMLSEIYSCIGQTDGTFMPKSKTDRGNDQDRLLEELSKSVPEARWNPPSGATKTMWTFPWIQGRDKSINYAVCKLPQGSLEPICQYGRSRGATVNDLILTAFYRTMFKISRPFFGVPMDIFSTIDLRRYLPDCSTQAIRNLTGGFVTSIARVPNESFEGTLSRVANATKAIKDGHPGVNSAVGEEYAVKLSSAYYRDYFEIMSGTPGNAAQRPAYTGNVCFPALSDLGYISESPIRFGENAATDAHIIPPAVHAPGFLLLAGSYNGILTISTGYYKASACDRSVYDFLNMIKYELMRGCARES